MNTDTTPLSLRDISPTAQGQTCICTSLRSRGVDTKCGGVKAKGFTLVEVLVALAIVAITLGAGLRVSGSQINNAERQGLMFRAQLCAENELIKLRLTRQLPDTGDKSFNCEQAGVTLAGKVHVEATPNPSFRKVDALVYQAAGDDRQAYTLVKLSTLVGRF